MIKLAISALASVCAIAANSNIVVSGETDKWYVETSLGLKDHTRSNYASIYDSGYPLGRWVDFNYGTDVYLGIGYHISDDIRISAGYKRSKQQSLKYFNGGTINTDFPFTHAINSYVISIYKDFPIANNNWAPYIGAGVGIAYVTDGSFERGNASRSSSTYKHITAGLSYSLKKIVLFGEASYGGVGNTVMDGSLPARLEKLYNLNGSFGVRYRF